MKLYKGKFSRIISANNTTASCFTELFDSKEDALLAVVSRMRENHNTEEYFFIFEYKYPKESQINKLLERSKYTIEEILSGWLRALDVESFHAIRLQVDDPELDFLHKAISPIVEELNKCLNNTFIQYGLQDYMSKIVSVTKYKFNHNDDTWEEVEK